MKQRIANVLVASIIYLPCLIVGFYMPVGAVSKNYQKGATLSMHMHHTHDHGHLHDKDHDYGPSFSIKDLFEQFKNPRRLIQQPHSRVMIIAGAVLLISSIIRKKLTRMDGIIFAVFAVSLSVFDTLKSAVKLWISKMMLLKNGIMKHSTPISKNYFFKNENLADRITLLGVAINIILSVSKFLGGIAFNSAVLVADAGHSLSDLFSDFITLWAVQIARLPADSDHPYGHGKFESVGSLFLALTLIATGLSVGVWSYDKMIAVLALAKQPKAIITTAASVAGAAAHNHGLFGHVHSHLQLPSWPALALATLSIISKEWLFRITKRVGESLNSQILIANAWHHRSDSFSSILSLASIALAMYIPGLLIADSAAGILVAGMISLTGFEVLFEAVKQLTDASDDAIVPDIVKVAKDVEGVRGVKNVRARSVGSGSLVDMTVTTDMKLSTSAAHAIAERTRWQIMESLPQVIDVMVRTQASDTICPLLSRNQRSNIDIELEVRNMIEKQFTSQVKSLRRVTVHYVNSAAVCVEVLLTVDPKLSIEQAKQTAKEIKQVLLKDEDIIQAEIQVDLTDEYENADQIILENIKNSSTSSEGGR